MESWTQNNTRSRLSHQFRPKAWNRRKVIAAIRILHSSGVPLNDGSISHDTSKKCKVFIAKAIGSPRTGIALLSAARIQFGSWTLALRAAGLDPKKIVRRKFWSRQLVIRSIRALVRSGVRVNSYRLQQDTTPKTVDILRSVTGKRTSGPSLHQRGQYYFGTWNNALKASGIDPNSFPREQFWTDDKFRQGVTALHLAGIPLQASQIRQNRSSKSKDILRDTIGRELSGRSLYYAARHNLKSWDRALRLAGLEPAQIRKIASKWAADRESIKEVIFILHQEMLPLNRSSIKESDLIKTVTSKRMGEVISGSSILRLAIREFGSWDATIKYCGYYLSEVRKRSNPCERNQKKLIEILRGLYYRNCALNASAVGAKSKQIRLFNEVEYGCDVSGNSLRSTAKDLFQSWPRALWAAGLDPSEICLRSQTATSNLPIIPYQVEDVKLPTGGGALTKYAGVAPKSPERVLEERESSHLLESVLDDFNAAEKAQVELIFDEILNIHHYRNQDQLIDFLAQKLKGTMSRDQITSLFSKLTHKLLAHKATS